MSVMVQMAAKAFGRVLQASLTDLCSKGAHFKERRREREAVQGAENAQNKENMLSRTRKELHVVEEMEFNLPVFAFQSSTEEKSAGGQITQALKGNRYIWRVGWTCLSLSPAC